MSGILGGLYSLGNRAKRQVRDFASSPLEYLQQAAAIPVDRLRGRNAADVARRTFDPSEEDIAASVDWWNPSPLGAIAGVVKQKGGNWAKGSIENALDGLGPYVDRDQLERFRKELAAIPMMVGATRSTGGAAHEVTDAFLSLRHNLSKDKLKAVTNSNTLPHPSLAVVHKDRPFTPFGSYSMVFDPKRIKPSAQNPLYARDVYTARGPETERLGEHLAKDILLNEDDPNPTHLLSVLHSPKFTKGWKEYKESPLGAGVLVPNANPVSYDAYLEDTMKLLAKYGITPQDIYEGKPVPKEVIDYVQKLPSEYAELKMGRDVVPSDSVRLISGPMDKDVRSMALDLGVSFIPTKSQLRSELPKIIREFDADFAAGGLVRMQQGGKVSPLRHDTRPPEKIRPVTPDQHVDEKIYQRVRPKQKREYEQILRMNITHPKHIETDRKQHGTD